jgi:hypothetical protein
MSSPQFPACGASLAAARCGRRAVMSGHVLAPSCRSAVLTGGPAIHAELTCNPLAGSSVPPPMLCRRFAQTARTTT